MIFVLFQGTFALGRLFAIVFASKFTAGFMLLWDIVSVLICFSVLLNEANYCDY